MKFLADECNHGKNLEMKKVLKQGKDFSIQGDFKLMVKTLGVGTEHCNKHVLYKNVLAQ